MKYIFYRHENGWHILRYSDNNGHHFSMRYFGYTLREAVSKFRRENHLRYKHITMKKQ